MVCISIALGVIVGGGDEQGLRHDIRPLVEISGYRHCQLAVRGRCCLIGLFAFAWASSTISAGATAPEYFGHDDPVLTSTQQRNRMRDAILREGQAKHTRTTVARRVYSQRSIHHRRFVAVRETPKMVDETVDDVQTPWIMLRWWQSLESWRGGQIRIEAPAASELVGDWPKERDDHVIGFRLGVPVQGEQLPPTVSGAGILWTDIARIVDRPTVPYGHRRRATHQIALETATLFDIIDYFRLSYADPTPEGSAVETLASLIRNGSFDVAAACRNWMYPEAYLLRVVGKKLVSELAKADPYTTIVTPRLSYRSTGIRLETRAGSALDMPSLRIRNPELSELLLDDPAMSTVRAQVRSVRENELGALYGVQPSMKVEHFAQAYHDGSIMVGKDGWLRVRDERVLERLFSSPAHSTRYSRVDMPADNEQTQTPSQPAVEAGKPSASPRVIGGDIGYIQLGEFEADVFFEHLGQLRDELDARGVELLRFIIDLRGNSGGPVKALDRIGSLLYPKYTPIYNEVRHSLSWPIVARLKDGSPVVPDAVAFVVDPLAASAAEALAGSLGDYGALGILDTTPLPIYRPRFGDHQTEGKAEALTEYDLPNGSTLYLYESRLTTPVTHFDWRRVGLPNLLQVPATYSTTGSEELVLEFGAAQLRAGEGRLDFERWKPTIER